MNMRSTLVPAALFLLPSTALAQTVTPVVQEGDTVAGVGNITLINNVAVNNSGTWLVEADTDAATTADVVALLNGALLLREDDPIGPPPGAMSSIGAVSLNSAGNVGWNLFMRNLTTSTDSGIFFNTTMVIHEGTVSTAPQFGAGTPYIGFFSGRLNDNNQMLIMASVNDPNLADTLQRALVIATVDGTGNLLSEAVIIKEGDMLPGIAVETTADLSTATHDFAFNNLGRALFTVDLTGVTATDGVLVIGDATTMTVLAQEGSPSPVAGRNYEFLQDRALDLNGADEWVIVANLDGALTDDELIVKNGTTIIAREGDNPPGIAGFTLTSFGTGAVDIDDSGNVFWFGDWNDTVTTQDTGIFRNNQLIVQEGVTMIGGQTLEFISTATDNFSVSPDGRYLIFEGRLVGSVDSAFLVDFGPTTPAPQPFCFGDGSGTPCPCGNSGAPGNGCASSVNPAGANLSVAGTSSLSADTLVLTTSGRPSNAPGLFFQGTTQVNGGLGNPFGDGLRCVAGTVVRLKIVVANPLGVASYPGAGDPSVSVRGMVAAPGVRHYQDWYRNANAFCTPDTFNLANGITVTWVP